MTNEAFVEALYIVDPHAAERARRLACALMLIRAGMHRREVLRVVRERFTLNRVTAWRIVDAAYDIAGNTK